MPLKETEFQDGAEEEATVALPELTRACGLWLKREARRTGEGAPKVTADAAVHPAVRRFLARTAEALDAHHAGREPRMTRAEVEAADLPLRTWGWRCEEVERVCDRIAATLVFYEARGPVAPIEDVEEADLAE